MGLVLIRDGEPFVLEAASQVELTPFSTWIASGKGGRYIVKRLRNSSLLADPDKLSSLEHAALSFMGKPYDPYFEWSDERIYCSELVWKAFDQGLDVQVGTLVPLSSFDLDSEVVKAKLAERYGAKVPMSEQVISPAAMFDSPLLETAK
jgi:uncharacterized protein YycO